MAEGNCEETLHELYHFIDGELTEAKRVHIQRHLEDCPPCLDAYDFEAELRSVVQNKCQERVPESLRRRIGEAIGHETD